MARSSLLALLLSASATITPASIALAQEAPVSSVRVEAALVRATRGEPKVDASLSAFARDLRALPYTTFTRVDGARWSSRVGASTTEKLGDDIVVKATVNTISDTGAELTVEVLRKGSSVLRTTVKRPFGRAHVLSAGRDGNAALVIPIRVVK